LGFVPAVTWLPAAGFLINEAQKLWVVACLATRIEKYCQYFSLAAQVDSREVT
jgi:hypothetical protein